MCVEWMVANISESKVAPASQRTTQGGDTAELRSCVYCIALEVDGSGALWTDQVVVCPWWFKMIEFLLNLCRFGH